jgi:NTP pyrophosphatase (non-canonical NTP hydrolase)
MSNFDYLAESALTASGKFYSDNVDPIILERILTDCIESLQALDKVKKSLFYGKDMGDLPAKYVDDIEHSLGVHYPDTDIVHGIIGAATESGELLEALYATLYQEKELDLVNVYEEVGDSTWYLAMLLRKAGRTFDDVFRNNITKLRKRFGEKFTEYDANNRDLDAERTILEDGLK